MSYLGRSAKLSLKAQEKVSFLATAGQTVKTGLSYTPSFVEVYVNGVLLTDTTDFTANNGNSITFTVALLLNDEVTVISLKTFTVADHYNKTEADTLLAAKATIANFTSTGIDDNATSNAITIDANENVTLTKSRNDTSANLTLLNSQSSGYGTAIDFNTGANGGYTLGRIDTENNSTGGMLRFFTSNTSEVVTERMRIDSAGIVTKPYQPAFCMSVNAYSNINASATAHVVRFGNQSTGNGLFNNGNNFNTTSYRFVAPVSGFYQFNANIRMDGTSGDYVYLTMMKNGSIRIGRDLDVGVGSYVNRAVNVVVPLSANDYVDCNATTSGDTNIGIDGDSYFSGHLIG